MLVGVTVGIGLPVACSRAARNAMALSYACAGVISHFGCLASTRVSPLPHLGHDREAVDLLVLRLATEKDLFEADRDGRQRIGIVDPAARSRCGSRARAKPGRPTP
jgi:hypothetical protein